MRQGPAARPVRSVRTPPPVRHARSGARPAAGGLARTRRRTPIGINSKPRIVIGRVCMVTALVLAGVKLVDIQGIQADALSAKAEQQRITKVMVPAQRGAITDRNGTKLAFSVDSRALYVLPQRTRAQWTDPKNANLHRGISFDQHTQQMADYISRLLGGAVGEPDLLGKLRADLPFVYLDQQVDPTIANQIITAFPEIGAERRSVREYPNGAVASNVVGVANWRADQKSVHGLGGLEHSMDAELGGKPGQELVDTAQGNDQVVIPSTERDVQPAVPGEDVQLTIDSDVQYVVQQKLAEYVAKTGAKDGTAVVMDAKTGEVYALADDKSFDPNNLSTLNPANSGDQAVTTPFEPGSVNKVVTAAAAIDEGLVTPSTVIDIPPVLQNADRTISDDWTHGADKYTVTGIFAKSSNIGAVELARLVGPQRFDAMLYRMGLGARTGIGLPGESAGYVPPMNKWSGSTFGNLPIGQGLSMTVVQMAGMYQAIANDGVRVPARIIRSVTMPDGSVMPTPQPAGVRVISTQAAQTVRSMMRSVTQKAPSPQGGTAPSAAVPGYQISGKTGTAQQIDPNCGCYSLSRNTVTFAGILSADNPRFVVGVMLDAPNGDVQGGQTAAPLFHEIASYLAQKYDLPVSPTPTPYETLVAR